MEFTPPRGMRDIDPEEFILQEKIRSTFLEVSKLFGFKLMEPSPMESLRALEAKSGPGIKNEIYHFKDKGNRDLGLRFDLTIGMTRYVSSRRDLQLPAKLGAFSGMWRYDEPQFGRYRWLHQWDIEIFGVTNIEADAEVIDFTSTLMKKIGLGGITIEIGNRKIIEEYVRSNLKIVNDSTVFEMLRAIDKVSKKTVSEILEEYERKGIKRTDLEGLMKFIKTQGTSEKTIERLKEAGLGQVEHLERLVDSLKSRNVDNIILNMGIVRGLDYYTGVVFEVVHEDKKLGALAGGGRYDTLPSVFGRPDLGATGAAGGIERMGLAMSGKRNYEPPNVNIYVACTKNLEREASEITSILRSNNIPCESEVSGRSLRKQMEIASLRSYLFVIIVAPREIATGKIILRNMEEGIEKTIELSQLVSEMQPFSK